jgi:hypothetical protein
MEEEQDSVKVRNPLAAYLERVSENTHEITLSVKRLDALLNPWFSCKRTLYLAWWRHTLGGSGQARRAALPGTDWKIAFIDHRHGCVHLKRNQ